MATAKSDAQSDSNSHYATGRRKTSVARVFLRQGKGAIQVNGMPLEKYFRRKSNRMLAKQALAVTAKGSGIDFFITVKGGGETGQAGAIRHGLAKVLTCMDMELKPILRNASPNLIERDARKVERKKVALRGARRAPQYSKR